MNINAYLPDDLGSRAKAAELPLSQLLQQAVVAELERRAAVATTLNEPTEHEIDFEDDDGRIITGRIVGSKIAYDERKDVTVFLTEDERVLVHDESTLKVHSIGPADDVNEWLRAWLDDDAYVEAMVALGEKPVIDL